MTVMINACLLSLLLLLLPLTLDARPSWQQAFQAANRTHWIAEGQAKAPHAAYIIMEPNCWYCQRYYLQVKPLIAAGQLKVRWILTAFLARDSLAKAATIIQSKHPTRLLARNERGYHSASGEGGVIAASPPSPQAIRKININQQFMNHFEFTATPTTLYRSPTGKIQVIKGLISTGALRDKLGQMSGQFVYR